jgi:hypothetical protein
MAGSLPPRLARARATTSASASFIDIQQLSSG